MPVCWAGRCVLGCVGACETCVCVCGCAWFAYSAYFATTSLGRCRQDDSALGAARQRERQADRETEQQADRPTYRQIETERQADRQTDRRRDRETHERKKREIGTTSGCASTTMHPASSWMASGAWAFPWIFPGSAAARWVSERCRARQAVSS